MLASRATRRGPSRRRERKSQNHATSGHPLLGAHGRGSEPRPRPKSEALTAADVQKAAARYFDSYRSAVVVVGEWKEVAAAVKPFGDVRRFDAEGKDQ